MRIQLLRNTFASSMDEAVNKVGNHLLSQFGFRDEMQPRGNIVSYFGEQIAFQVRLYKPYTNFILYAFWVPLNNNKIATAEKLLRENNHEYFVNQD